MVAPRAFNTGEGVATDCSMVEVTDAASLAPNARTTAAAVGAGMGAGAGAAVTRMADAARVRMKEEMHCILATRLGGWFGGVVFLAVG